MYVKFTNSHRLEILILYGNVVYIETTLLDSSIKFLKSVYTNTITFFSRYHNDRMINYDSERGVSVSKDNSGSTLSLTVARTEDSGNYTCSPYNIRPASVLVHVLSEGNSAAAVQNEQDQKSKPERNSPPSAAVQSSEAVSLIAAASTKTRIVLLLLLYYSRW